jgi:hypothetical protein
MPTWRASRAFDHECKATTKRITLLFTFINSAMTPGSCSAPLNSQFFILQLSSKEASKPTRNRILTHRRVRAGDLLPHEWNFRAHPDAQKAALQAIYEEVGFARSLLAYQLPDGRLKLIDGHLRRDLDPDMEVDVEILDVNEEEARKLLLSIDPLAALAETRTQLHERLLEVTTTSSPDLDAAWNAAATAAMYHESPPGCVECIKEQFLILVTCRDEEHQVELLERFAAEGLVCKALLS